MVALHEHHLRLRFELEGLSRCVDEYGACTGGWSTVVIDAIAGQNIVFNRASPTVEVLPLLLLPGSGREEEGIESMSLRALLSFISFTRFR